MSDQAPWFSARSLLLVMLAAVVIAAVALWQLGFDPRDGRLAAVTLAAVAAIWLILEFVRRRFRLSLRTFFVAFTATILVLGVYADRGVKVLQRRQAVERIRRTGGTAEFKRTEAWFRTEGGLVLPSWLRQISAGNAFGKVWRVDLPAACDDAELRVVRPALIDVTTLQLDHTQVTDSGLQHLANLGALQDLILGGHQVSRTGVQHLRRVPQLRHITFWRTDITAESTAYLGELPQLTVLDFYSTNLADGSCRHLRDLDRVEELHIRDSRLAEEELSHLRHMNGLRVLDLSRSAVSDGAIKYLKELQQLTLLNVAFTEITPEGIAQLQASLPNCRVYVPDW